MPVKRGKGAYGLYLKPTTLILIVDTTTGMISLEGKLESEEVLDIAHSLMDIAYDLAQEDRTNIKFSSFTELYRKS